jgi:hypothetical protein
VPDGASLSFSHWQMMNTAYFKYHITSAPIEVNPRGLVPSKRMGKEEEEAEQVAGLAPLFPYVMTKFDAEYFEL